MSGHDNIANILKHDHNVFMRLVFGTLACAAVWSPTIALATPDVRAQDAADAFSQLCLSVYVDGESSVDAHRFDVTELDEAFRTRMPHIKASTLWDVHAKQSDASMLVHYEPSGICVVEIAEADEVSIQHAVAQAAADAATSLNTNAVSQVAGTHEIEGMTATNFTWRFKSERGDVMIMLTTLPESKVMIQHVITASYVR